MLKSKPYSNVGYYDHRSSGKHSKRESIQVDSLIIFARISFSILYSDYSAFVGGIYWFFLV